MKKERLTRLKELMLVQSKSYDFEVMHSFLKEWVSTNVPEATLVDEKDNLYITKGDGPVYPCVVAHTDTVHKIIPNMGVYHVGDNMFAINKDTGKQTGIGGDDKVGIFVALEMLLLHDNMKVAFFHDEEVGCKGSSEANVEFFKDTAFALQCDRRGYKDFVRSISGNKLFDDAFSQAIASLLDAYGKEEQLHGGMTDVNALYRLGVNVCMANISCGYYDPHTASETIKVSEVDLTVNLVDDIINKCGHKQWINSDFKKYTPPVYNNKNWDYGKSFNKATNPDYIWYQGKYVHKSQHPNYSFHPQSGTYRYHPTTTNSSVGKTTTKPAIAGNEEIEGGAHFDMPGQETSVECTSFTCKGKKHRMVFIRSIGLLHCHKCEEFTHPAHYKP